MTWNKRIPLLAQEGWLLDLKSPIVRYATKMCNTLSNCFGWLHMAV